MSAPRLVPARPYVGKHRLNESETEYPRWYFWTFITLFAALLTVVGSIGFRVAPEDPDYYEQHLTAVTSSCAAPGWVIRPVSAVEVVR